MNPTRHKKVAILELQGCDKVDAGVGGEFESKKKPSNNTQSVLFDGYSKKYLDYFFNNSI